jgi:hypothetical protein
MDVSSSQHRSRRFKKRIASINEHRINMSGIEFVLLSTVFPAVAAYWFATSPELATKAKAPREEGAEVFVPTRRRSLTVVVSDLSLEGAPENTTQSLRSSPRAVAQAAVQVE